MAATTKIAWCDSTFNPWLGACGSPQHAIITTRPRSRGVQGIANVMGSICGTRAERVRASPVYWRQPPRWNRDALKRGARRRVFCASMADVFDNQAPPDWRAPTCGCRSAPSLRSTGYC